MNNYPPDPTDRKAYPISRIMKICLLGGFAVGKTSLVSCFPDNAFSEDYVTTVEVRIDTKTVSISDNPLRLVLWDLYGDDQFQTIQSAYLRCASGYFLVADASRPGTLKRAVRIQRWVEANCPPLPFVLLLNKADLDDDNGLDRRDFLKIGRRGWRVMPTSAKTGEGVDYAFKALAAEIIENSANGSARCLTA